MQMSGELLRYVIRNLCAACASDAPRAESAACSHFARRPIDLEIGTAHLFRMRRRLRPPVRPPVPALSEEEGEALPSAAKYCFHWCVSVGRRDSELLSVFFVYRRIVSLAFFLLPRLASFAEHVTAADIYC